MNGCSGLDANLPKIDIYNMAEAVPCASARTTRSGASASGRTPRKKATQLTAQAEKMRAKATKAVAAQNMLKRAERMLDGVEGERQTDRVASLRFPKPAPAARPR